MADRPRVLVVDDSDHSRIAAVRALRGQDYEIIQATSAAGAEAVWQDEAPDLVLLDVNLPDANGVELSHRWKTDPEREAVPVILRSSVSVSTAEQALGLDSGADGYLTEPTDREVLAATVAAHLRIRELLLSQTVATHYASGLVEYSVELAKMESPDDVIKLLGDFAESLLEACDWRLAWQDHGAQRGGRFGSRTIEEPIFLDRLLDHANVGSLDTPTFFLRNEHEVPKVTLPTDRYSSWALVPFRVGDTSGALAVSCFDPRLFDDAEKGLFLTFVNLTAISLAHTAETDLNRQIAETLQEALLPAPELHPDVRSERGLYVAAGATLAGGDWFDGYLLPDGQQFLVIGDVVGHGAGAAAVSAIFRHTIRTLMMTGYTLSDALYELDRLLSVHPQHPSGTVLAMVIDVDTGSVVSCSAGHLPPLVSGPDGVWREFDVPVSPPIGYGLHRRVPAVKHGVIERGDVTVAFTDGVVERRGEIVDAGMDRLAELLAGASEVGPIADRLNAWLGDSDLGDDALFHVMGIVPVGDENRPADG